MNYTFRLIRAACFYLLAGVLRIIGVHTLVSLYPKVASEIDTQQSEGINIFKLKKQSNKYIVFRCTKQGHRWRTQISKRTARSQGCPYHPCCSNGRASKQYNLLTEFPDIAAEWDHGKNTDDTPESVRPFSPKSIHWKHRIVSMLGRVETHYWKARIADRTKRKDSCPYCAGKIPSPDHNLAVDNPSLAAQWHPTKNGKLNPCDVTPHSDTVAHWQASCGHVWAARVASRNTKGYPGCPKCRPGTSAIELRILSELRVILFDIEILHRDRSIGAEIDVRAPSIGINIEVDSLYYHQGRVEQELNKNRLVEGLNEKLIRVRENGLTRLSSHDIYYSQKDSEEDIVFSLVRGMLDTLSLPQVITIALQEYLLEGEFVAELSYQRGLARKSMSSEESSLDSLFPEIAGELHPTKNGGLKATNISAKSNRKVTWLGTCGHEWVARIANRTTLNQGCPHFPCTHNPRSSDSYNLAVIAPDLAAEWHPSRNGELTPTESTPTSGRKVWWKDKEGNEWEAKISNRCDSKGNIKAGCPIQKQKNKKPVKQRKLSPKYNLAVVNPIVASEWHPKKNRNKSPDQVSPGSKKKYWFKCKNKDCLHEWSAAVCNLTYADGRPKSGCPNCRKKAA